MIKRCNTLINRNMTTMIIIYKAKKTLFVILFFWIKILLLKMLKMMVTVFSGLYLNWCLILKIFIWILKFNAVIIVKIKS